MVHRHTPYETKKWKVRCQLKTAETKKKPNWTIQKHLTILDNQPKKTHGRKTDPYQNRSEKPNLATRRMC